MGVSDKLRREDLPGREHVVTGGDVVDLAAPLDARAAKNSGRCGARSTPALT